MISVNNYIKSLESTQTEVSNLFNDLLILIGKKSQPENKIKKKVKQTFYQQKNNILFFFRGKNSFQKKKVLMMK